MTTIFEALASEQREIEVLFRRLLQARALGAARSVFCVLSSRLVALLRSERLVVYPHFAAIPGLHDEVLAARAAHAEIEAGIARLRIGSFDSDGWFAEAAMLHMQVRELVYIEECALFPVARLTLATNLADKLVRDLARAGAQTTPMAGVSITYELAS